MSSQWVILDSVFASPLPLQPFLSCFCLSVRMNVWTVHLLMWSYSQFKCRHNMRRRIQHHDLCHSTLTHTHTTSKSEVAMPNPAPHIVTTSPHHNFIFIFIFHLHLYYVYSEMYFLHWQKSRSNRTNSPSHTNAQTQQKHFKNYFQTKFSPNFELKICFVFVVTMTDGAGFWLTSFDRSAAEIDQPLNRRSWRWRWRRFFLVLYGQHAIEPALDSLHLLGHRKVICLWNFLWGVYRISKLRNCQKRNFTPAWCGIIGTEHLHGVCQVRGRDIVNIKRVAEHWQ